MSQQVRQEKTKVAASGMMIIATEKDDVVVERNDVTVSDVS